MKNHTYYLELETDSFTFAQVFSLGGWQIQWVQSTFTAQAFSLIKVRNSETITLPLMQVTGNGIAVPNRGTVINAANFTNFGSTTSEAVSRTFTLRNAGTTDLHLTSNPAVSVGGAGNGFRISSQPTVTSLTPGTSTAFTVTFQPVAGQLGTATGTVQIASDDAASTPYRFVVGANVARPDISITSSSNTEIASGDASPTTNDGTDFGAMPVGGAAIERNFVVHNIGTDLLSLSSSPSVRISGANASDFAVVAQPLPSIAAGDWTSFTVRFNASATGARAATLIIASNDTDESSYTFALAGSGTGTEVTTKIIGLSGNLAFGYVTVNTTATSTVTISNTGNTALNVTSINYPSGFGGNWPSGTIPAGGTQPVTVTFSPMLAQAYSGTITVNSDKTNGRILSRFQAQAYLPARRRSQ